MFGRKAKNVLYVEICGNLPRVRGLQEIITRRATVDEIILGLSDEYDGFIFDISHSNLTLSEIWEIRERIKELRGYGKKTIAVLREGGIPEVFLADAFENVFIVEGAKFFLTGFFTNFNMLGNFFKKLKIEIESVKSGKLKSIPDILSKTKLPEDIRKETEGIFEGIKGIIEKELLRFPKSIIFSGIVGLDGVDGVLKSDENIIKKFFGDAKVREISRGFEFDIIRREKKIAVINMYGVISSSHGINLISPQFFSRILKGVIENDSIVGTVLRINSRGGDATASEILNDKIKDIKKVKPAIVSISSICASGGYLLVSPADYIFSTPFSLVGSIGVFLVKPNVSNLMKFLGINTETVKIGKMADILSPMKKLSIEEKKELQKLVEEYHQKFIRIVSDGRKIPSDDVEKIADGRVFLGEKAKELKLVDEIGGLKKAVEHISRKWGVKKLSILPKMTFYDLIPSFITKGKSYSLISIDFVPVI